MRYPAGMHAYWPPLPVPDSISFHPGDSLYSSAQQLIVVGVIADPKPKTTAGDLHGQRAVVQTDTRGPKAPYFI